VSVRVPETRPSLRGFRVVRAGTMTAPPVTAPPLEGEWPPHPHVDLNLRYRSGFSTRQAGLCAGRDRRVRSWREVSPQQPICVCLRCMHGLGAKQAVRGRLRPRVLRCGPLRFAVSGCGNGRSADTARLLGSIPGTRRLGGRAGFPAAQWAVVRKWRGTRKRGSVRGLMPGT
jgi:hypothetical protein